MAFLRFSVSAVIVLHAAILFTTFFSLLSEWSFLGMVNCQGGSSHVGHLDAVHYSPLALKNDFSEMQDQGMVIYQNDKFMPAVHQTHHSNSLARENNDGATLQRYQNPNVMAEYYPSHYKNPNVINPYYSTGYPNLNVMDKYYSSGSQNPIVVEAHPSNDQNPVVMDPNMSSQPPRRCCADCRDGDLDCLSSCELYGCKPTAVCANAGQGAYVSFCQRECDDQLRGFSADETMTFLPDKACRANCVKYVQQMCVRHQCTNYGCVVNNCAIRAVGICG